MINIKLIMTDMINSKWFHWHERSLQHIIQWNSYIGIDNELMRYVSDQLIKIIFIRMW